MPTTTTTAICTDFAASEAAIVTQVKIRGCDVHKAVRNLLLNEFKLVPADLVAVVDKRITDAIDKAVEKVMEKWGFRAAVERRLNEVIANAAATLTAKIDKLMAEQVKEFIGQRLTDALLNRVVAPVGV